MAITHSSFWASFILHLVRPLSIMHDCDNRAIFVSCQLGHILVLQSEQSRDLCAKKQFKVAIHISIVSILNLFQCWSYFQ